MWGVWDHLSSVGREDKDGGMLNIKGKTVCVMEKEHKKQATNGKEEKLWGSHRQSQVCRSVDKPDLTSSPLSSL